jgi:hypothetical protein
MKKLTVLVVTLSALSCKQNNCAVCDRVVVGPDIVNGGITHDTIYSGNKYCGDELDDEKKENGKFTEYKQGTNTYRWTTQVRCH